MRDQYSANFFETVLKPLGGPDGIDYWWIDWQQGETPIAPGVNPTIWVNYVFSSARSWFSPQDRYSSGTHVNFFMSDHSNRAVVVSSIAGR